MNQANLTNAKRQGKQQQNQESSPSRILQIASALRNVLEIEPLEQRLLLSGIGAGLNKKKVSFTDAGGDKVTVSLTGGVKGAHPTFTIVLDGAASNNADIQSITLNGNAAGSALSILVTPVKIKLPNTIANLNGQPYTFSSGFVDVASITSATGLHGISANSAILDSIVIGTSTETSAANLGSLAISIGTSQAFAAGALTQVHLGDVTDFGHIGSIVLHGTSADPINLTGTITATQGIDTVSAPFSNLLGTINVTGAATGVNGVGVAGVGIGSLTVQNLAGTVTAAGGVGGISAQNWTGLVSANSFGNLIINGVSFTGTIQSATTIGNLSAGAFTGANIQAGSSIGNISSVGNISGTTIIAGGSIGNITSTSGFIGGSGTATNNGTPADFIQGASVGNITAQGDISGNVITATTGNIGNFLSQEGRIAFNTVTAQGSIGNIGATSQHASYAFDSGGHLISESSSASAIQGDTFTAVTGAIGNITANASVVSSSASGIDNVVFSAYSGIGNVTAVASGHYGGNSGIVHSTFNVLGTKVSGSAIGNVSGSAVGGSGISNTTFHAYSGNIGYVTGRSVYGSWCPARLPSMRSPETSEWLK